MEEMLLAKLRIEEFGEVIGLWETVDNSVSEKWGVMIDKNREDRGGNWSVESCACVVAWERSGKVIDEGCCTGVRYGLVYTGDGKSDQQRS